jgi:hypothetical protein
MLNKIFQIAMRQEQHTSIASPLMDLDVSVFFFVFFVFFFCLCFSVLRTKEIYMQMFTKV